MVSGEQPDQVDIITCVQVKVWDRRRRQPVASLNSTYQVTAVQFSEDASQVVSAGIDNDIKIWDLRKNAVVTDIQVQSPGNPDFFMMVLLQGHSDTVTGMKLSPDGAYVLTNSMDNTVRIWVSVKEGGMVVLRVLW